MEIFEYSVAAIAAVYAFCNMCTCACVSVSDVCKQLVSTSSRFAIRNNRVRPELIVCRRAKNVMRRHKLSSSTLTMRLYKFTYLATSFQLFFLFFFFFLMLLICPYFFVTHEYIWYQLIFSVRSAANCALSNVACVWCVCSCVNWYHPNILRYLVSNFFFFDFRLLLFDRCVCLYIVIFVCWVFFFFL